VTPLLALLAMAVERATAYPAPLFAAVGHPVTWIGRLIAAFDRRLNREDWPERRRRAGGVLALALLLAVAVAAGLPLQALAATGLLGLLAVAILASSLIAQRSLAAHVAAVADALEAGGLAAGRRAVALIVGRDPDDLDEAGVCRAAVESLAENFSDGVVAPVFWLAVAGAPGALAYKAVNTADSMIGHRTPRHRAFGWAAARLDDLVNIPASRLSALLLVAAAAAMPGASARGAWAAVWRDASRHTSPNAGWPEAATAGALGFALAGPRRYGGRRLDAAEMNRGGRRALRPSDIRRALRLYWIADGLLFLLVAAAALALAISA
jgi:adenosylcobinamide-phosphate synthase